MDRRDVSFTFIHRVEEVELNIEDGRWQSALALALTLPDICGAIAFPDIVKRYRDGRVMLDRQKNPTRDVGSQYIKWFDEYASAFFKIVPEDDKPYICGERCWQLRCEYLHQNKGFVNEEDDDEVRFHLGVNCGTSVCRFEETSYQDSDLDIRIDIEQFCYRMCQASRNYYLLMKKDKDFSMYNTPVLDFVEVKKKEISNPLVVVVCANESYGKGIQLTLRQMTDNLILYASLQDAKKELGRKKPRIWVIVDMAGRQIRLVSKKEEEMLPMPVRPDDLRESVYKYLE